MRFSAAAYFAPAVRHRETFTTDDDPDSLHAETPQAAARKWFWRLEDGQRASCDRIVISAWTRHPTAPWDSYAGPPLAFYPHRNWKCDPPDRSAG
jgi:hypothetical protein